MSFLLGNNLTFTNTASHGAVFSNNRLSSINDVTSNKTKYQDSSAHIATKKINAIGKNRANNTNYSDGGNKNIIKSHLGKMRSFGTVTPKKYNVK